MEFSAQRPPFSIEQGSRGDGQGALVRVTGEMDYVAGAELAAAIRRPLESGRAVVVDLTEVTFMDSSGIAAIIAATRDPDERGRISIVPSRHRQPARLAELTGMSSLFASDAEAPAQGEDPV